MYNKDKYQKEKLNRAMWQKRYNNKRNMAIIEYYSQGTNECKCCGEKEMEFLTINHIDNNCAKHKEGYPEGYQILCMNCNMSKGKHGKCIHKPEHLGGWTR